MISDLEFWRLMEQRIREKRRDTRNELAAGSANDHAAYRYSVGKIDGYEDVMVLAREVYGRMMGHDTVPEPLPKDDERDDDFPI